MRSHSATFIAIGFSQSTCLPASAAATVCSAWRLNRRRHVDRVDLGIAHQIPPVGVPPARADLARERLEEIDSRAADGHELAPAAVP